jgi:hypothetical protein
MVVEWLVGVKISNPLLCLDLLVLADLHGASTVRSLALKFIVDNGKEIVAQAGWRDKLKVGGLVTG